MHAARHPLNTCSTFLDGGGDEDSLLTAAAIARPVFLTQWNHRQWALAGVIDNRQCYLAIVLTFRSFNKKGEGCQKIDILETPDIRWPAGTSE